MPHFQGHGGPVFVTFKTKDFWQIPDNARSTVLKHCSHDHRIKMNLSCALVMPDHVHMVFQPLPDSQGKVFLIKEIVSGIKGASAHSLNKLLNRKGHVWQDERFDHVIRSCEKIEETIQYIRMNPVRKGLCEKPEEYPWLWMNGITAGGGCATTD